jgi:hypothetical protein
MKKFKKVVLCLALTSVVSAFSIVGGASAADTTTTATTTPGSVTVTDLGKNAIFSSNASQAKDQDSIIIRPMATDGRNISYDFAHVSNFVKTDALPTSTYGSVPLKIVQWTPSSSTIAAFEYQFSNASGTKTSTAKEVVGDIQTSSYTLYFTDVPQGTASDPIYLYIRQAGTDNNNYGNGYTTY